jgi:hypothetical protein
MRIHRYLLATWMLAPLVGCASISDSRYETTQMLRAKSAWRSLPDCAKSHCYPEDYKLGWCDGYYDVLTGGKGCPPVIAPERYWKPEQILENCDRRRHAYYDGFQDGVACALSQPDTHYLKMWSSCECPLPTCEPACPTLTPACPTASECSSCNGVPQAMMTPVDGPLEGMIEHQTESSYVEEQGLIVDQQVSLPSPVQQALTTADPVGEPIHMVPTRVPSNAKPSATVPVQMASPLMPTAQSKSLPSSQPQASEKNSVGKPSVPETPVSVQKDTLSITPSAWTSKYDLATTSNSHLAGAIKHMELIESPMVRSAVPFYPADQNGAPVRYVARPNLDAPK